MTLTLADFSSESDRLSAVAGERLVFGRAPAQVERMIARSVPFERVEDAIDAAPFADGHKSSLWLLAWSLRESEVQRRDARLMAGQFTARGDQGGPARLCPDLDAPAPA